MASDTKGEKEKMGNIARFQNGGGYNRDEFSENGVPVVRVSDFTGDSIDLSECKYLPEDYPNEYEKYNLRRGDVLISTVGSWPGKSKSSVGKVVKVPKKAEGCLLNQNIVRLRKRDGKTNQRYLFYLAKSKSFQRHIANNARGSANHARVAISMLEEFEFKFPPLPVQHRIADILGALDDKIELNHRMNETLEEMAQTLYQHWFVDFGPFQDREFKDTEELGPIPEGWEVGKLSDYCTVNRETVNKDDPPDPIEYIKISGVNEGRVEETEEMSWDESPTRANRRVQDGDILWSKVRPNRKGYFLCLEPPENLVVSTGFATITPRQLPFSWVYLSLTTDDFVEHLTARATGAAYPSVTLDAFRGAEFAIPDNDVLEAFHNEVEPLFRLQRSNTAENETLAETRDYLLPKLISGEIEVEAAEEVTEEALDVSA